MEPADAEVDPRYDMPPLNLGRTSFPIGDYYEEDTLKGELSKAQAFQYGAIQDPHDIRVLWLFPRVEKGTIHCLLTHQSSSEAQYQAISYTWGNAEKTRSIMCNGGVLRVTENLFSLLNDLRDFGDPAAIKPMWIDAICIDQDDLPERESQVRIMIDIYRAALSTLVWLGPYRDSTTQAFDLLDEIYRASRVEEFQEFLARDDIDISDLDHSSFQKYRFDGSWDAVEKLLSFDWYERVWICQEVAASKEVLVFCGGHVRPWDRFVQAAFWMQRLRFARDTLSDLPLHIEHVLRIEQYRLDYHAHGGSTLLELIGTSRNCKSSNPLDKIYGVLGLVRDIGGLQSVVSYSTKPADLYALTSFICFDIYKTLDVMNLCRNDPDGKLLNSPLGDKQWWPSTVPDFAEVPQYRQLSRKLGRAHWRYHASKETPAEMSKIARDDVGEDCIDFCFTGINFDTIKEVGTEMTYHSGISFGQHVREWFEFSVLLEGQSYITQKDLQDLRSQSIQTENEQNTSSKEKPELRKEIANLPQDTKDKLVAMLKEQELMAQEQEQQQQQEPKSVAPEVQHDNHDIQVNDYRSYPTGESIMSVFWRTMIGNRDSDDQIPDKSIAKTHFRRWLAAALPADLGWWMSSFSHEDLHGERPLQTFNTWVDQASLGTRIFRTTRGYIGTGPPCLLKGDLVCILFGGQTPFILRPVGEQFLLLGDCYVHGIMEGEALEMGLAEEKFHMV